jgi:mannose-6-phosphate isomerase-like protein (cupin superfamily)
MVLSLVVARTASREPLLRTIAPAVGAKVAPQADSDRFAVITDVPVTTSRIELDGDDRGFQKLRHELGVESFGLNVLSLRPGQRNRIHRHLRQEEVYVVLEGELTLLVEGEAVVLGKYEAVRIEPPVRRQLTNPGSEPVVLLALGGYGEHEGRDGRAWSSWEEQGEGKPPQEVPLPEDLPPA